MTGTVELHHWNDATTLSDILFLSSKKISALTTFYLSNIFNILQSFLSDDKLYNLSESS